MKKTSLPVNSIEFGVITAFALIALSALLIMDGKQESKLAWLGYGILIGGMAWGTSNYRKKALNGFMSYGQAMGSCYLILLFASICLSIFMYIYMKFMDPHLMDNAMLQAEEGMRKQNLPDDQIEMGMAWVRMFMTPIAISIITFIAYQIVGTLIALIVSIFLTKPDPNPLGIGTNIIDNI